MGVLSRWSVIAFVAAGTQVQASPIRIRVDTEDIIAHVSHTMTGACLEDVNHEVYGGIYSQMVFGESFQEPPSPLTEGAGVRGAVSGMWRPVTRGEAEGTYELVADRPWVGAQSQRMSMASGRGAVGIENRGLNRWGIGVREGAPYEGILIARAERPVALTVALEKADGSLHYAEANVTATDVRWQRIAFTLTPSAEDAAARFSIWLDEPGTVDLGYVYLSPGEWGRFAGLPVRRDVAEALAEQGLTVLRYGGSMVNTDEYRWKRMIGPREARPPYRGFWYPYSTNGWGIVDFVALCEALGVLGVPAANMGEDPNDVADLVEHLSGPAYTEWGARRAADRHPKPYGLQLIQLGNEEAVDGTYFERFRPMAEAIWRRDEDITIVVGDFMYGKPIEDPYRFEGSPVITSLDAHRRILELAREHDREVWFDIHVWSERPESLSGIEAIPSLARALGDLCPSARFKLAVFELNAGKHDLGRALANARSINQLERLGDVVRIVCSANCLQPDGQNDNGWDQGLLFLNPATVWPQPAYFVTQMLSRSYLPLCVRADVEGAEGVLDVTAKRSGDGTVLQLQVVNMSNAPVDATVDTGTFQARGAAAVEELAGTIEATNTASMPDAVRPTQREELLPEGARALDLTFAANSFTIVRLEGGHPARGDESVHRHSGAHG